MNTNNLKPEIEMLKQESAPEHLKAQIVQAILDENKSKKMNKLKVLGFGLPAIALGIIAFGAAMAPKTALADPIAQTRDAFEAARKYHMTTYQVVDSQRKRISESWFEDGKRTTYAVGEDGNLTLIDDTLVEIQANVSGAILRLEPSELAQGSEVQQEIQEFIVVGTSLEVSSVKGVYGLPRTIDPKVVTGNATFEVQEPETIKGEFFTIYLMPFVDAEMSIESLQKLLLDNSLWDIEQHQTVDGKPAHKYKLKEAFMDFTVYVDPKTKLPILTRQILTDDKGKSTTTEVEYEYDGSIPPVVAEKAKPALIAPGKAVETKK